MDIETFGISLGDKVRDQITGYEGVVVAVTQWLAGCARLAVPGPLDKDGKIPEPVSFDVTQLTRLEPVAQVDPVPHRTTGGPRPEPSRGR